MRDEDTREKAREIFGICKRCSNRFTKQQLELVINTKIGKVVPCTNSEFNGIECLEDSEHYGFFKNDIDVRPSSCIWIKKEQAEKLFNIFKENFKK